MIKFFTSLLVIFMLIGCQYQPEEFTIVNDLISVDDASYLGIKSIQLTFKNKYNFPDDGFNNIGNKGPFGGNNVKYIILINTSADEYKDKVGQRISLAVLPIRFDPPIGIKTSKN